MLAVQKSGGPEFAVLPRGARPAHYLAQLMNSGGDDIGEMEIEPDGEMSLTRPATAARP
jgi:hypothetical protein